MQKPNQRISTSKKLKDKDWQINTSMYYRELCSNYAIDPERAMLLAKAANGEIDESDYEYITNPFKRTGRAELQGYPAKIRNVDIIKVGLMRLMGQKSQRNYPFEVIVKNSDFPGKLKEMEGKLILQSIQQEFVNELISIGAYDGKQEPPMSPEVIKKQLSSVTDQKAIMGQDFLDYTFYYSDILRKFRKGFYDWLAFARVFSRKDVRNEELEYEVISPLEISYMKSADTEFLEDCEAVKRTKLYSFTEVCDMFSEFDDFTEEIRKNLEVRDRAWNGNTAQAISMTNGYTGVDLHRNTLKNQLDTVSTNNADITVEHIVFKTSTKVGKRIFIDENSKPQEDIVSEEYIPTEEEQVKWIWVSESWETYVVDGRWVLGTRPLPLTRASINNPTISKLPYNGRLELSRYFDPKSIVDTLIPYQIKVNIIHYFIEKVMSKNKDKIMVMPLGLIPEKEGHDMFTTMYHADASGYLFVDESNPNAMAALNAVKILDGSLDGYIMSAYKILAQVKNDADEAIGMTPQFKGEIQASALKGPTQSAISNGLLAMEEMFVQYEEFEEREAQGFLDLGKYICVNGKKGAFISSDYKRKYLEVEPDSFTEAEFGVFARRSAEEREKIATLRQMAQPLVQNGMKASGMAKVLDANNIAKLVEELQEQERILDERIKAKEDADRQVEQSVVKQKEDQAKAEDDLARYKIDKEYELKRQNKLDEAETRIIVQDKKDNAGKDVHEFDRIALERQKVADKAIENASKTRMKEKELEVKSGIEHRKIDVQQEQGGSKE